jgi:hypothetical protein
MSLLKSFDFFQKFSIENISKPTIIGSILSLTAMSIMIFLLVREIHVFYTPTFVKDTVIYHEEDQQSQLAVNLNMHFHHMPCGLLSVDQEDQIGNHRLDISDTLTKHKYGSNGNVLHGPVQTELDDVAKSVEDDEQCRLTGHIMINKVPGNIHISHHAYRQLWEYMRHVKPDRFPMLTLSHNTSGINFGDYKQLKQIFKRFGFANQHTEFNRHDSLPDFRNTQKKNYDYFLKIIPYLFVDKELGKNTLGYQYSLNHRERDYDDHPGNQHIITINYDFSPITMRITREKKYYSSFLTHICAIVGGIFVIFSIINRTYLTCFDCEKSE